MGTVIKINNLRKEYKDIVAVYDLNLEIKENELFGLLGVNGAGKTTIKMLAGLLKPTSWEGYICDYSINDELVFKTDELRKEIERLMNVWIPIYNSEIGVCKIFNFLTIYIFIV